jgi:hypothetical protein
MPYIKSVGVYATDVEEAEKRDLPPINIKPYIKSVGVYAADKPAAED